MLLGIIYIHRISDNQFGGIAGRNFNMFRQLCGYTAFKSAILVTNMWDEVSYSVGEARERELSGRFFRLVLDHGALMTRHNNTAQSAHNIIRRILRNDPVLLRIQRELVHERRDIVNTTAGGSIKRQLNERIGRHRDELDELREEMNRALREKDEVAWQELEGERRRLQERMEEATKDSENMIINYAVEKARIEAKVNEVEQNTKKRKREEAECRRQMANARHLQDETNVYVANRTRPDQHQEKPETIINPEGPER